MSAPSEPSAAQALGEAVMPSSKEVGVQTQRPMLGAQLRIHTSDSPSISQILAATVTPALALLNGICYHLYWRYMFMSEQYMLVTGEENSEPQSTGGAPAAYFGLVAAVFFQWIVSQYVVQLALRALVHPATPHDASAATRRVLVWYCVACFPFMTCNFTLYGQGYTPTLSARSQQPASPAPHVEAPHVGLFVVTTAANTISFAISVSYLWCDWVVTWLENGVREAAQRSRAMSRPSATSSTRKQSNARTKSTNATSKSSSLDTSANSPSLESFTSHSTARGTA